MLGPVSECGPPPSYCNRSIPLLCPSLPRTVPLAGYEALAQDEEAIKEYLYSHGPLSVLLDATGLQRYRAGLREAEEGLVLMPW
jgi:hypothetical protein